jgi:hypothetical protein
MGEGDMRQTRLSHSQPLVHWSWAYRKERQMAGLSQYIWRSGREEGREQGAHPVQSPSDTHDKSWEDWLVLSPAIRYTTVFQGFFFFSFWQYWGLNSGSHAWLVG